PRIGQTTPLHEAAKQGDLASVERLLTEGVDPDAPDEYGMTALHWAARNGHMGTTGVLLDTHTDATLTDTAGKTALDYALQNGHEGTANRIRQAGGTTGESMIASSTAVRAREINPSAPFQDVKSFERAIGMRATLLTDDNVWFFGPKALEEQMTIVFPYLTQAYEELFDIVGQHTEYIIVTYAF